MGLSSWLRQWSAGRASRGRPQHRPAAPRFRPWIEALEPRCVPARADFTVNSLLDSGPGTLRAAIQDAKPASLSEPFIIRFAVTGTINLQTPLPDLTSNIASNIAIQGPGESRLTVEEAPGLPFNGPLFTVDFGAAVSLSGLTLANSLSGISNAGTLTVADCAIVNNHAPAPFGGGGLYNLRGTMTISGCTISGNSSAGGSGIYVYDGTVTIRSSTISGNSAPTGGGIKNANASGTVTITGTTLSGNSAGLGGAIYNAGTLTIANGSKLIGNSATDGGGIYNTAAAALEVQGSAFSCNTASDSGGGIYNLGTATLQTSSLSGNSAGSAGGGIFNGVSGALTIDESNVCDNLAPLGADLYNLGAMTLHDSDVCVIGP
jgi:hypothetical protein